MQRVTSLLPSWGQTKTGSKKGFDKVWGWADKLGAPVNKLTNKIGSEAFWPTTLDKESDKAARILRSFCKDGFYEEEEYQVNNGNGDGAGPKQKQKVLVKIPQKVIENCVGLAIFTTMRTGLWISGAGGSGVLVARNEDGSWSPPTGILLHTAGLGFLVGVDIYDCVVVINNRKALESFTHVRATIGGEISAVAGPVGIGGVLENDGKWKQANRPVFTYLKSRGFYAGVQVDGTVIIERSDENERFYGEKLRAQDILAGKVRHPPAEIKMLMETLKAAEGRSDVDQEMMEELEDQPAPGDVAVESPSLPTFGVPEPDDPDPFGVHALEDAGLEIREAGTRDRPDSTVFEYKPSPTSPLFNQWQNRHSVDTFTSKSNRGSYMSHMSNKTRTSTDRGTQTGDMSTQTESTPGTSPSLVDENKRIVEEPQEIEEIDYTKIDLGPYQSLNASQRESQEDFPKTVTEDLGVDGIEKEMKNLEVDQHRTSIEDSDLDSEPEEDDDDEEIVVYEAGSAQATPAVVASRGAIVNIARRSPPSLPPRSPARASYNSGRKESPESVRSVQRAQSGGFDEVDLHASDVPGEGQGIEMHDDEKDEFHSVSATPDAIAEHAVAEIHA